MKDVSQSVEARFDPRRILKGLAASGFYDFGKVEARFDPGGILKGRRAPGGPAQGDG